MSLAFLGVVALVVAVTAGRDFVRSFARRRSHSDLREALDTLARITAPPEERTPTAERRARTPDVPHVRLVDGETAPPPALSERRRSGATPAVRPAAQPWSRAISVPADTRLREVLVRGLEPGEPTPPERPAAPHRQSAPAAGRRTRR